MFVFVALTSILRSQSLIVLLELTDMFLQQMYLLTADTRLALEDDVVQFVTR